VLAEDFRGGWLKRLLAGLEIGQDVPKIFRIWGFAQSEQARPPGFCRDLPDSRKVGLAVQPGNRPGHIHLAIGRARSPGSRLVQPLGLRAQASSKKSYSYPDITTHTAD
jgi:hypothetical protein